ncbi:MAG: hypothetical protein AAF399_18395, partial [Bacteroidota bacterium]
MVIPLDLPDSPQVVLVAPLDWGLGHATRCMPVIEELIQAGHQVILAGAGRSLMLLKRAYPHLPAQELPGYRVRYTRGIMQVPYILVQVPRLLGVIGKEHRMLRGWIRQHQIQYIISDNRYGLWAKGIPSAFICHQLAVKVPLPWRWLHRLIYHVHLFAMRRFDQIWVPDRQGADSLSGELSQWFALPKKVRFVGGLSRFESRRIPADFSLPELKQKRPDIAVVISGPEPQRSWLEASIWEQAKELTQSLWVVGGKPEAQQIEWRGTHARIPFLASDDLHLLLTEAKWVVSRSGYSSLMDYEALGLQQLLLIPTPGQTE